MEDFVTFEQAVMLKKLGFDWDCGYYYNECNQKFMPNTNDSYGQLNTNDLLDNINRIWNCISAPTLSQTRKWLGEVKDINIVSNFKFHKGKVKYSWYIVTDNGQRGICDDPEKSIFDTYEEALLNGIDKALELLKI